MKIFNTTEHWVSKFNLTKSREDGIRKCFNYRKVEFHYTDDVEDLNLLIETFQKDTYDEDDKTNNGNIFPSTIQLGNILKILTNNCDRETINYIPARDLWINRLYLSLSNESKYSCSTIYCRKSDPAKYRTNADGNFEQFCYYGQNKKDRLFNKFLAKRVEQRNNSLVFQIHSMINLTKSCETKIYEAVQELKSLVKHNDGNDRSSD